MLRQRILTSSILVPLLVGQIIYLGSTGLALLMAMFITIAAWEWARICGWQTQLSRLSYAGFIGSCLLLVWLGSWLLPSSIWVVLSVACGWWLLGLHWIWFSQRAGKPCLPQHITTKAGLGILILVPPWLAFYVLHQQLGGELVVFLFVLIWAADSGAYFVGRRWGQQKLADKVSPGKTWEGVLGAMLMTMIVGIGYLFISTTAAIQDATCDVVAGFLGLCVLTMFASIVGDLLESLFKRQMGLKDSSRILPGHGGVLDRIDSLTAAAPVFVLGIMPLLGQALTP